MRLLIEIFADDAAFGPDPRIELARMLQSASQRVLNAEPTGRPIKALDANGANAGQMVLSEGNRTPGRNPCQRLPLTASR